jgi:hypothetical protein
MHVIQYIECFAGVHFLTGVAIHDDVTLLKGLPTSWVTAVTSIGSRFN